MRTVFNIEITTNIGINDEVRRKHFIKLLTRTAKALYAQIGMAQDRQGIEMSLQASDNEHGNTIIPIEFKDDDDAIGNNNE